MNEYLAEFQRSDKATGERRYDLVRKFAFAVPNAEAIQELVKHSPLIEIGAGTGYWAKLVSEAGGDIVAYDSRPIVTGKNRWFKPGVSDEWFPVKPGGIAKLREHPERTLFLSWPPYGSSMAAQAVRAYKGENLVYVGEGSGGCTGDRVFHELLGEEHYCWESMCKHRPPKPQFGLERKIDIPQWQGIHDRLYVYKRILGV